MPATDAQCQLKENRENELQRLSNYETCQYTQPIPDTQPTKTVLWLHLGTWNNKAGKTIANRIKGKGKPVTKLENISYVQDTHGEYIIPAKHTDRQQKTLSYIANPRQ